MKLNKGTWGGITLLRTALVCISGLSALKSCSTKSGPGFRIGHPAPSMQDVGKKPSPEFMQIAGYCKYPVYRKDWIKKRARGKIGCEKTGRWTKGKPHPGKLGAWGQKEPHMQNSPAASRGGSGSHGVRLPINIHSSSNIVVVVVVGDGVAGDDVAECG